MKKILLFSCTLFCAFFLSMVAQAQVVGFVLNPQPIRGNYDIGIPASAWGVSLDTVVATGRLVIGRSAGGAAAGDSLACDTTLVNASAIAGKIAVLYRGNCEFGVKALAAQRAGAIGLIIINHSPGILNMAGGGVGAQVTIPLVLIGNAEGALIRPYIDGDSTVALIGQKRGAFRNDIGFSTGDLIRPMDMAVPRTQIQAAGDYIMKLGAIVRNYGIDTQNAITMNLVVDHTNLAGSTNPVYNQTATIPALVPGDSFIVRLNDYDPFTAGRGLYTLRFNVQSSTTDDFDADNSNVQEFRITDTVYSKVRLNAQLNPLTSGGVRPTDATSGPYEYGVFYYSKVGGETRVDKIKFAFVTNAGFNLNNETVVAKVSRWDDGNGNEVIDAGEVFDIGEGFYTYTDTLGSGSIKTADITDIASQTNGVVLDTGVYILSTVYTGTQTGVFTSIGTGVDYSASSPEYNQYASPVYVSAWNANGFGADYVPVIVAITSEAPSVGVRDQGMDVRDLKVYPNPVGDRLWMNAVVRPGVQNLSWEVMDAAGKVMNTGSASGIMDGRWNGSLSTAELPAGLYILRMDAGSSSQFRKFVVVH
ncbi:MAG: PA domain-containing protein [Bacteroidota bacterium]